MTDHTDDDLDAALRQWGSEQRATADDTVAPPIADLLAGRRQRHTIVAVAATVVLVAALAAGLGFGSHLGSAPTATPAVAHHPNSTTADSAHPDSHRPCWQQFEDAGSDISSNGLGFVNLRYTGSAVCRIFDQPHVDLVSSAGRVTGPHAPTATLNRQSIVRPGQSVQFRLQIALACPSPSVGYYSLRLYFRPMPGASTEPGVAVPVGLLRPQDPTVTCSTRRLTAADTGPVAVTGYVSGAVTRAQLIRTARREAVADGDPSASADAVRTFLGHAERTLLGVDGSSGAVAWVIQLRGHFRDTECQACLGGDVRIELRGGACELLIYQGPELSLTDARSQSDPWDLTKLGTVVQLIP